MTDFQKHHRKLRKQGGKTDWGNMIELPAEVHQAVHENPSVAYEHGLLVKSHDDPSQIIPKVREFCAEVGIEYPVVKRPRARLQGEERAKRKTISVRLPEGVDGEMWDELLGEAEAVELEQPDTPFDPTKGGVAVGKLLVTILERYAGRVV